MGLKSKVSREYLKQHIGDEAIFKYYFGDFSLGKAYNSVFRKDNKCSTGFYVTENGSLIYNDLATSEKYDFVKFVAKLKNLSYYGAVEQIAKDFNVNGSKDFTVSTTTIKPITKKPKDLFKVTIRPFSKKDIAYWEQFAITKQELIQNNIYSVSKVEVGDKLIYTDYGQLKFAYLFKDEDNTNGYFKVYSPLNKEFKWSGNVPISLPFGINNLPLKNKTLILTKSVKDCVILRKFFPECIGLQNESKSSIRHETLLALQKIYKEIIVFFDADNPGKEAAKYYTEQYGFKSVHTPDILFEKYKIKDPGDFVQQRGIEDFEKWLKYIKLL